jgi:hypothetical protein
MPGQRSRSDIIAEYNQNVDEINNLRGYVRYKASSLADYEKDQLKQPVEKRKDLSFLRWEVANVTRILDDYIARNIELRILLQ